MKTSQLESLFVYYNSQEFVVTGKYPNIASEFTIMHSSDPNKVKEFLSMFDTEPTYTKLAEKELH